jgi:hypothetical protein
MKKSLILLTLFSLLLIGQKGYAQVVQDTAKIYKIETTDGNEFVGYITLRNAEIVKIKTSNLGEITINQKNIVKINEISKDRIQDGYVSYGELHAPRYFASSNGYGLKRGSGYYQNMWIFYNQVGYGITNNFSVGVGLVPLFLFGGASSPVWITPKFTFPVKKDRINLGIGILAASVIGESTEPVGFAYGVSTFGSPNNNLSIGIGYGFYGNNWANTPVISVNGKVKVGKRGYIMTENYYIDIENERVVLSMIGGRTLVRKVALDYGLVIPIYDNISKVVAIPWLGLTVPIHSN